MKIKERIKRLGLLNVILFSCGLILLGSVSVLFGYALCNNGLILASSKQNVGQYYLIELDKFNDYNQAIEFSAQVTKQGGAGFIRFDDGYRVFLAGYLNKKDAESVLNKTEGYERAKIYTLYIDEFDFDNGFGNATNQIIKNNIVAFKCAIESLNNVLIEFDSGKKTENDVKNCCLMINEELNQQIDKFLDNYYLSSDMLNYKHHILEFYDLIDNIQKLDVVGKEFSVVARYQEIGCMFLLQTILNLV